MGLRPAQGPSWGKIANGSEVCAKNRKELLFGDRVDPLGTQALPGVAAAFAISPRACPAQTGLSRANQISKSALSKQPQQGRQWTWMLALGYGHLSLGLRREKHVQDPDGPTDVLSAGIVLIEPNGVDGSFSHMDSEGGDSFAACASGVPNFTPGYGSTGRLWRTLPSALARSGGRFRCFAGLLSPFKARGY